MSKDKGEFKDFSDRDWDIRANGDAPATIEGATLQVLMDIRRELKRLNALFKDQPFVYYPKGDGK